AAHDRSSADVRVSRPEQQCADDARGYRGDAAPPLRPSCGVVSDRIDAPAEPREIAVEPRTRPLYCGFDVIRSLIHVDVSLTVSLVLGSGTIFVKRLRPACTATKPAIASTTPATRKPPPLGHPNTAPAPHANP